MIRITNDTKETLLQALSRWTNECSKDVSEIKKNDYVPDALKQMIEQNYNRLNALLEKLDEVLEGKIVVALSEDEAEDCGVYDTPDYEEV